MVTLKEKIVEHKGLCAFKGNHVCSKDVAEAVKQLKDRCHRSFAYVGMSPQAKKIIGLHHQRVQEIIDEVFGTWE